MIKQLVKYSKNIITKDLLGNTRNLKPGDKWKVEVEGEVKNMSNKGFNDTQKKEITEIVKDIVLETVPKMIKEIVPPIVENIVDQKLKPVIERLDNIESRLDRIENLPTIKKEMMEIE